MRGEDGRQVGILGRHVDEAPAVGEGDGVPTGRAGQPLQPGEAVAEQVAELVLPGQPDHVGGRDAVERPLGGAVEPDHLPADRLHHLDRHLRHHEHRVVEIAVRDPEPVARAGLPGAPLLREQPPEPPGVVVADHLPILPGGTMARAGVGGYADPTPAVRITKRRFTMRNRDVPTVVRLLEHARYEVLPTPTIEEKVLAGVPTDVQLTVTASPTKGLEQTFDLTERLAKQGYDVVPHLAARMVSGRSELRGDRGPPRRARRHHRLRPRRRRATPSATTPTRSPCCTTSPRSGRRSPASGSRATRSPTPPSTTT